LRSLTGQEVPFLVSHNEFHVVFLNYFSMRNDQMNCRWILCFAFAAVVLVPDTSHAGILTANSNAVYRKTVGGVVDTEISDPMATSSSPFDLTSMVTTSEGFNIDFSGDAFAHSEIFGGGITTAAGVSTAVRAEGLFAGGRQFYELFAESTYTEILPGSLGPSLYEFFVTGPVLQIFANGTISSLDERPVMDYHISIARNGVTQFESSATMSGDVIEVDLIKSGTDLGGTPFSTGLGWRSEFSDFVGSFNVTGGDQIDYLLRAKVSTFGFETGGLATVGDPGSLEGVGGGIQPGNSVVPEPCALSVWSGLGAVFLMRRRKRNGNEVRATPSVEC
jgi:hypothetical protein